MTQHSSPRSAGPPPEWDALRERLAARFRQLNDEIRHYPRPIARCDEQLTRLIEQRDRVRGLRGRMAACDESNSAAERPHDILEEALRDDEIAAAMAPEFKELGPGGK